MTPSDALDDRPATRPIVGLGIDCGGTGMRWTLLRRSSDGREEALGRGQLGPLSGLAFLPGADVHDFETATARIAQLACEVHGRLGDAVTGSAPDAIRAGVTGLSSDDAAADRLRRSLAEALGTGSERVYVVNDMELAYRARFAPGDGVLLYAGTGAIAVHLTSDGTLWRAGGHGYLIDDAGGGFWIGREALSIVLREADLRGAPAEGPLADAIYEALGARTWPAIRSIVYGGGRARVAELVPAVGSAARAGDTSAMSIINRAGAELARLATVLLERLGGRDSVSLAGGTAGLGVPFVNAISAGLPPGTSLDRATIDTVDAAARWAVRDAARADAADAHA